MTFFARPIQLFADEPLASKLVMARQMIEVALEVAPLVKAFAEGAMADALARAASQL